MGIKLDQNWMMIMMMMMSSVSSQARHGTVGRATTLKFNLLNTTLKVPVIKCLVT